MGIAGPIWHYTPRGISRGGKEWQDLGALGVSGGRRLKSGEVGREPWRRWRSRSWTAVEGAGLSTEYYPKLTPREMLFRSGAINMLTVRVRDGPLHCEIELTVEQGYLLHELGFRQPGDYLPYLKPDHTIGSAELEW